MYGNSYFDIEQSSFMLILIAGYTPMTCLGGQWHSCPSVVGQKVITDSQYKNDMFSISQFSQADHAMLLVGWSCEHKSWLLQNSWGEEWGNRGQIYLRDDNVCKDGVISAHSGGAGPACMFGSSISAFTINK